MLFFRSTGMPGLLEAMQSRLEAAPAVVNAGVPEDVGPPVSLDGVVTYLMNAHFFSEKNLYEFGAHYAG